MVFTTSYAGDAGDPRFCYPLYLLNEAPAGDLRRADLLLSVRCDWRVLVWVVEWIPQQFDVCCLQCSESLNGVSTVTLLLSNRPTGLRSASRSPTAVAALLSSAVAGLPSMSTTITILTPVLVSQPYIASRSSTAWRSPKSWSAVLKGSRASKISRHDERRNWNSSGALSSAGKSDMCNGLF